MSTATETLAKYIKAEQDMLAGKIVRWGDRELRYEDLSMIQAGRKDWQAQVNAEVLEGAGKSSMRIATANFSGRGCG